MKTKKILIEYPSDENLGHIIWNAILKKVDYPMDIGEEESVKTKDIEISRCLAKISDKELLNYISKLKGVKYICIQT